MLFNIFCLIYTLTILNYFYNPVSSEALTCPMPMLEIKQSCVRKMFKGSVRKKIKGVYVDVELNSISIATKFASLRRKLLTTIYTRECKPCTQEVALFHSDFKYIN